jgi:ubiquinone/menaquinone biosynthesis C-methylase UbiE
MPADHYAASDRRWALGAELVYRPIAAALVATSPHPLSGRMVLDAGAGTGAASAALRRCAAHVVAMDLSPTMLAWQAAARPPCAAADIRALPLPAHVVDDSVAAFVLNHLGDPLSGLAELRRVTRAGGTILAAVFASNSRSEARDRIDASAAAAGWQAPAWYREMKNAAAPILGTAPAMAAAAHAAGLASVHAEERRVDVGVTEPGRLVRYRLGHPAFAAWLDDIGPERAAAVAAEAERAIGTAMAPYQPSVIFLRALAGPPES